MEKMISEQRHKEHEGISHMSIREKRNPGREQTLPGRPMAGGCLACLSKITGNGVASTEEVRGGRRGSQSCSGEATPPRILPSTLQEVGIHWKILNAGVVSYV